MCGSIARPGPGPGKSAVARKGHQSHRRDPFQRETGSCERIQQSRHAAGISSALLKLQSHLSLPRCIVLKLSTVFLSSQRAKSLCPLDPGFVAQSLKDC